jgi:hypothetical protein
MAIPGIQEIQALATKYSKPQLQKMAQMGLIDPTKAVMAGMMIDRIQKQNMQMPQQTVADEVMGSNVLRDRFGNVVRSGSGQAIRTGVQQDRFGNVIRSSDRQSEGIAGLPSNLPEEMAGGGIVAFADGGDIDDYADGGVVRYQTGGRAGIIDVVDPNWASSKSFKRNYTADDKFAILAEQLAQLTAAERQAEGLDKVRIQKDIAELQSTMRGIKAGPAARSLVDQIPLPSAAAAEPRRQSKAAATDVDYYQDPLGVPDYTTEGFSLKEKVEPGKKYDPSLRGLLFGYEEGKLPDITPPEKAKTKPEAAPAPVPKAAEKEAAKVEKAEVGPPKPDMFTALRNIGIAEPEALTPEKALAEQDRIYTQLGVDKDLFSKIRQDYEGRRGKFADRAEKAAGHALMMFGAGLLGARRGEEFATASKSAQQSLMMYMSSMDKLAEQDDKLDQSLRELTVAEDQYKRTRADSALARVQKQQEKIDNIRLENAKLELTAAAKAAEFNVDLIKTENPPQYKLIERIAKESGKSPTEVFMMAQGITKTGGLTLNQALEAVQRNTQFMGKPFSEQLQEAQRAVGASGGGGASLSVGQVVDGYKYKGGDPNSQSSWEKVK